MGEGIRVLHVDDEPDFADVTATWLEREDDRFTVETATSASGGLDRLAAGEVDCIVSDYEMPGMDGLEFLAAVREEYPDLPFILFTAKGSEQVASDAISGGVTDYLQKGGDSSQYAVLANRIRNAVDQYRAQQRLAESERELERQNRRLSALFEQFPEPTLTYVYEDEEPYVVDVNEAFTEVFGYSETEAVGEHVDDLVVPPDRRDEAERIDERVRAGETLDEVLRRQTSDGIRDFWFRNIRLEDDDEVDGYAIYADITERRERERELERSRQRYRTLLETAPDAIFVADPETGEIIKTNETATRLLGRPREEIVGMEQTELHPPERAEEYAELFEEHVAATDARDATLDEQHDIYVVDADGDRIPVEISARVVEIDGRPLIQGYFRDITRRKEHIRELERQNERLEQFTSVVSHDLRNPLQVLESYLEEAETTGDTEYFDRCYRALDRMNQLIENLLRLARHGERIEDREPVAIADLVDACWETVDTTDATYAVDTDLTVAADESRLRQLFENCFRNSVEHGSTSNRTESGDSVEHATGGGDQGASVEDGGSETVTVRVGTLEDGTGFYVEDDGVGIPPEKRTAVFEPGFSTDDDGDGFGLAIVAEIVEAHDWEITLTESDAGGARFEISGVDPVT